MVMIYNDSNVSPIVLTSDKVKCYGKDKSSPHPCIYIHLEVGKAERCPYCGMVYIRSEGLNNKH